MENFVANNLPIVHRLKHDYLAQMASGRADALSRAAQAAHDVFDEITANLNTVQAVACTRGCAFCCHAKVNLNAAEAFALVRHVRSLPAPLQATLSARLAAADSRTRNLDGLQRWSLRQPCPLLSDEGACQAYQARPLACRAHASFDQAACRAEFDSGAAKGIPAVRELHQFRALLWTALSLAERDITGRLDVFELIAALRVLLDSPEGEEQAWLRGTDTLAGAMDGAASARRQAFIASLEL